MIHGNGNVPEERLCLADIGAALAWVIGHRLLVDDLHVRADKALDQLRKLNHRILGRVANVHRRRHIRVHQRHETFRFGWGGGGLNVELALTLDIMRVTTVFSTSRLEGTNR